MLGFLKYDFLRIKPMVKAEAYLEPCQASKIERFAN